MNTALGKFKLLHKIVLIVGSFTLPIAGIDFTAADLRLERLHDAWRGMLTSLAGFTLRTA